MSSTLTPFNGLQVLSPNPTGDAGLAINDNFKELSERIASPSTIVVPATGTATENGTDLLSAYATAKTLTPYGNAISATNRVTIILSPGIYDVGASALSLDSSYIDLAGTGANPDDTRITRTITTGAVSTGTIVHTADYVNVTNLNIQMVISGSPSFTHDDTEPAALFIASALANVVYDRVNFSSMRRSINYAGEFRFCTCNSDYGFGGGYTGTSTASGRFTACKSGNLSFGGAETAGTGNATGTFLLCQAGAMSFGKTTASGKFYFCTGSVLCFSGSTGTFIGCSGNMSGFGNKTDGRFVECRVDSTIFSSAPLVTDGSNMSVGASTGTKLGTATTQKLGFYGATPITQPINTTDLRQSLINLGLLATGGATPLDLNGGALAAGYVKIVALSNGILRAEPSQSASYGCQLQANYNAANSFDLKYVNSVIALRHTRDQNNLDILQIGDNHSQCRGVQFLRYGGEAARIDANTGHFGIGGVTSPTSALDVTGSTTSAASLRIRSGTAPTSPNDGDIWYDGTDLKIRVGGTTKTVTLS